MRQKLLNERACAMLSLLSCAAWEEGLPQPLSRAAVHKMVACGALEGLVLRDVAGIEEACMERARLLLGRVGAVYDCLLAYEAAGYTLILPGEEDWPHALDRLGSRAPLYLMAMGNKELLRGERIAVAGSRRILEETKRAAVESGRMVAQEGMTLVTGGAQGVDTAAASGALHAGGGVVIVPAKPAAEILRRRTYRSALHEGRLLLLCDELPDEPFSAKKALTRNHTIYALGRETLVVAARDGRGGSWSGATDCLRGGYGSVRVWEGDNADTAGCRTLERLGAKAYSLNRPLRDQLCAPEQMCLL